MGLKARFKKVKTKFEKVRIEREAKQSAKLDREMAKTKKELEKEKLVVIEEIHRGNDNPSRVFSREMFKAAYDVHPYGRTVIGTPESVSGISRTDMIKFHTAWYVPRNMKLVAVGGVKADDMIELAQRFFTAPDDKRKARREVVEPTREELRTFRLAMDSEPARLAVAFPIGDLTDPETPVLDLVAAIRAVHEGDVFLYPSVARVLVQSYLGGAMAHRDRARYDGLTDREREVLTLIADGCLGKEGSPV